MNTAFHVVVLYARLYYMHDYLLVLLCYMHDYLLVLLCYMHDWLLVLVLVLSVSVSYA